jgi:hypothetical protein
MIDFYFDGLLFQQALPTILSLLIDAMTVLVSSCTTESTYSKTKLIKTVAHNKTMCPIIDLVIYHY